MCYHHCHTTFEGRQGLHPRAPTYASIMEILILKGVEKYQAKKAAKAAVRAAKAAHGLSDTDSDSMASSRPSQSQASTPNRLSTAASLEKSMLRDVDVEKSDLLAPPAYQHVAA